MHAVATYLHGHGEVILGFGREKDVDSLLDERLVPGRGSADLDDVKLSALGRPDGEAEESGVGGVALHAKLAEGGRVAFDGLTDLAFHGIELAVNVIKRVFTKLS